ncbi:hypothetical protein AHF37_12728 [Paragonimus kellicotti]|nr:hypothetical protein AHF37_12728 [Paragonimus kellicotti]
MCEFGYQSANFSAFILSAQFQLIPIVETFDARYIYVHNNQTKFIILTDLNAPMFRLIIIDLVTPTSWCVVYMGMVKIDG